MASDPETPRTPPPTVEGVRQYLLDHGIIAEEIDSLCDRWLEPDPLTPPAETPAQMVTKCCDRTIAAEDRYCPKCGWEARVSHPVAAAPHAGVIQRLRAQVDRKLISVAHWRGIAMRAHDTGKIAAEANADLLADIAQVEADLARDAASALAARELATPPVQSNPANPAQLLRGGPVVTPPVEPFTREQVVEMSQRVEVDLDTPYYDRGVGSEGLRDIAAMLRAYAAHLARAAEGQP